nr:MAG TPA: antitoxin [Caudoviricetes sp.]
MILLLRTISPLCMSTSTAPYQVRPTTDRVFNNSSKTVSGDILTR